jgi:glutathione synthase/RimK-type ligase-like ATP-grasp enzyme
MSAKTFTFVTYCDLPNLDADDRLVAAELEKRGFECHVADWRNQGVDWDSAGICILRSTWDYHLHYDEFLSWISKVSAKTTLWNNVDLLRWNSNKRYLFDLERASVPIVPAVLFEQNKPVDLTAVLDDRGWKKGVLKPIVGLSTFGVRKIERSESDIQLHLNTMLETSDVLLQPFIETVHKRGERALVFLGKEYSHTIRKSAFQPLAQAGEAGETLEQVDENELRIARQVLAQVNKPVAFARIDLIRDENGQDLLMELELVEPSLYLNMYPPAISAFADTLCKLATVEPNLPRVQ